MQTPTIVKQTKDYLLIKVPLPRPDGASRAMQKDGKLTAPEKRLLKTPQESECDVRAGRVITAPNITEALHRYEKRQWD